MRLTKKRADNGRYYLSGLAEVSNISPKGYGRIQAGHAVEKLAEYEDLEEQGKLLKLPCAVGDTVYRINKGAKEYIIPMKVCEVGVISLKVGGFVIQIMCRDESDNGETYYLSTDFGKTVFLTREDAEAELKEL